MAQRPRSMQVNTPVVYNHNQMLKEIRDNLKHLRREPENAMEGKDVVTHVVYNGNATVPTRRANHARFSPQRNNFVEQNRGHEHLQANRNYDESGYSSSSSECSSQSTNDLNGQFVGNMPNFLNNEDALHQSLFSPSSFDFVRAMASNDGFQRINPNVSRAREPPTSIAQMPFPTKSPPPYRFAAQKAYTTPPDHQPIATHLTSKVETSKFMQTTALPSGSTTISQAEWKVTKVPEMPTRGKSPVPYARPVVPEGGALWKSRPCSLNQKQLPASANGNHGNWAYPKQQKPQQMATPQFQVQVCLNTGNEPSSNVPRANVAPANFTPAVSKSPAQSATFCVSVQTSPVAMGTEPDSRGFPSMQSGYPRPEPAMNYHDSPATSQYGFQPSASPSNNYIQRSQQYPPPYMPFRPPPPSDSSQSSLTSYLGSESDVKSYSSTQSYCDSPLDNQAHPMDSWSHRNVPSMDGMSVSSDGSDSHLTIKDDDFSGFELASVMPYEENDEDIPTVYTNKTGTLIVHVGKRPEIDVGQREISESPVNGETRSQRRHTSPEAYKFFMEQRVENILKAQKEREQRRVQLEEEMQRVHLSEDAQSEMRKILSQKESNYIRLKRSKMNPSMFTKLQVIGVGAFGEVCLTRHVQSGSLYAMKILKKSEVLKRNQVAHVKAERDILAEADNEWVVKLFYSFQDKDNLYFVMEYVPGGDLMSLLIKRGFFPEDMARFYIAELVLAIESVHRMGFIHRDIKPDNVLIDSDGHIKLTDFGLCTGFRWTHDSTYYQSGTLPRNHSRNPSLDFDDSTWAKEHKCRCGHAVDGQKPLARRHIRQHMRCQAHSLVGTPNYIAPEVLMRIPYTHLCDWWSVGVILYEMLVGRPPFYSVSAAETQMKVINWETTLNIPRQAELSSEAEDLILRLCTSANQRLGNGGVDDIKNHPFFNGIDWLMIRKRNAYFVPQIRHPEDTSNFDPVEPERPQDSECESMAEVSEDGTKSKHPTHGFYEFTFRRFFTKDQARSSVSNYSSWDETESDESKAPVFV